LKGRRSRLRNLGAAAELRQNATALPDGQAPSRSFLGKGGEQRARLVEAAAGEQHLLDVETVYPTISAGIPRMNLEFEADPSDFPGFP
jgi:hypothetical protein